MPSNLLVYSAKRKRLDFWFTREFWVCLLPKKRKKEMMNPILTFFVQSVWGKMGEEGSYTVTIPGTGWVVSNISYVHPYLGKIPILTNIFQMGWNHQPVQPFKEKKHPSCWWNSWALLPFFGGLKLLKPSRSSMRFIGCRYTYIKYKSMGLEYFPPLGQKFYGKCR